MTDPLEPPEGGQESPAGEPSPEVSAPPAPQPEPADAPPRRSWMRTVGALALASLAAALVATQIAGVLLRDRVEGRLATLTEPPPTPAPQRPSGEPTQPVSRLGAEVREVVVGPARVPGAPPAPPPPAAPGKPPPATESAPVKPAAVEAPGRPTPTPSGDGLQVGIFRSQKYRKETEDILDRLGAPRFRIQTTRPGVGFRLVVPTTAEARSRAPSILDDRGVLFARAADRLIAYFHVEEEVQSVLAELSKAGIQAGYGRFEGDMPLWTVWVGPFTPAETARWENRLHEAGLDTYRRTLP